LIECYYQEEIKKVKARPLWEQFDSPMRAALRYQARKRAERRAAQEVKSKGVL